MYHDLEILVVTIKASYKKILYNEIKIHRD